MAILLSRSDTNLTSNGWYTSQGNSTFNPNHATVLALSTTRYTAAFTLANNCNMLGGVIALSLGSYATAGGVSVTVTLQQNSGGWADVVGATKTLTVDNIVGSYTGYVGGVTRQFVYFEFTTPAAVTTAANTWRFKISQSSGSAAHNLVTCDGTNPFYLTQCDYATATPSSGNDQLVVLDDTVSVNATHTIPYTATVLTSAIICAGGTMQWTNPPTANWTLTNQGYFFISWNGLFTIGTSTTALNSSYTAEFALQCESTNSRALVINYGRFETYGAQPTFWRTQLAATTSVGGTALTGSDSTGWVNGNEIIISDSTSYTNAEARTVNNTSTTTINITAGVTYEKLSGDWVCLLTRNVIISSDTTVTAGNRGYIYDLYHYNQICRWTRFRYIAYVNYVIIAVAARGTDDFTGSVFDTCYSGIYMNNHLPSRKVTLQYVTAYNITGFFSGSSNASANITMDTCMVICSTGGNTIIAPNKITTFAMTDCYVNTQRGLTANGTMVNVTITNTSFRGGSNSIYNSGGMFINVVGTNNVYGGSSFAGGFVNWYEKNSTISTFDTAEASGFYYEGLFENCAMTLNIADFDGCAVGTRVKCHTYNTTANQHSVFSKYGQMDSTGTGLADTTCHTAGGYALRFLPTSSTSNLSWDFDVPTGNIQNNTIFIGVWCKINSATYYAGTHQLPRLTISYDSAVSTAYSQAAESTDWQLLIVPITPTTTYGQITVTLSARTDATTTNAYVYWDDFMVAYPPNVSLDLGGMDLWANALPITPPIAIPISAKTVSSAVWEELISSHTTASTFGKHVGNKLLSVAKFLGLK